MIDFDEVEELELKVEDVREPEGPDEPFPELPGFRPAGHRGGCGHGKRLKLLCFHAANSNAALMERQMNVLFASSGTPGSQVTWLDSLAQWECVDGPLELPELVAPPTSRSLGEAAASLEPPAPQRVLPEGMGAPRAWFTKDSLGCLTEEWTGMPAALDAALSHLEARGPVDGLCGFGQGGDLVCQLARLAEAGHARVQGYFKFVMTKAARWPKACGGGSSCSRPSRPLRIPAVHLLERSHAAYTAADFEDLALHWGPDCREVIWLVKEDPPRGLPAGARPPPQRPARLSREQAAHLRAFLAAFQAGEEAAWRPSDGQAAGMPSMALPLPRRRPAGLAPPSPSRPMLLLCLHDTDGIPAGGDMSHQAWNPLKRSLMGTPLAGCFRFETPSLLRMLQLSEDIAAREPACKALERHHVVSDRAVELGAALAEALVAPGGALAGCTGAAADGSQAQPVLLAGIGLGSYFALCAAAALRAQGGHPWRICAVNPPAIFPPLDVGALGGCSISCFIDEWDTSGERWRFAAATHGPCAVKAIRRGIPSAQLSFLPGQEDTCPWARAVVEDLVDAFR